MPIHAMLRQTVFVECLPTNYLVDSAARLLLDVVGLAHVSHQPKVKKKVHHDAACIQVVYVCNPAST